ncbi:MAG TPA: zinc ribbon domain-containing protein [Candidatus Udaeobacter sp.]|jgi:hypothetical protein|nr:zinc ribbon domain-containing protein [Candidatus Udaeobacter sp.]
MTDQTLLNGWAAHLAPPLFSWFDVGATAIVLIIAGMLLAGMFMFVRLASDDSDRYRDLKEIVETLFGTPAHLRQPSEQISAKGDGKSEGGSSASAAPFSEPCPACNETVTERDSVCPSCGLRLL